MGEIKSVKVDNWGVFFLQKLQNFFNKTDYCDLTLQFNDNSQLKVHRLVLSACTEYFNLLEKSIECNDDILLMPYDLQADVVVPIVNFMYTGTLEFEYAMYDRLFRTAREMNMTVLVKLLEAHRKTAQPVTQRPQLIINRLIGKGQTMGQIQAASTARSTTAASKTYLSPQKPVQRKVIPARPAVKAQPQRNAPVKAQQVQQVVSKINLPETIAIVSKYRPSEKAKSSGPSRFEPNEDETLITDSFDTFNEISYESQPLVKDEDTEEDDEYQPSTSSTFEELRKGYTNPNKRAAVTIVSSQPVAKKLNLQDVKEYTEAARLRKQLEAEQEDDPNYVYDDDTHFNDDDDEEATPSKSTSIEYVTKPRSANKSNTEDDNDSSQIIVKDSSGSVNHAQIISEVLKKYPHLVKNNKNIKLKIMQKNNTPGTSGQSTNNISLQKVKQEKQTVSSPPQITVTKIKKEKQETPVKVSPPKPQAPKRIDSKLMHALIAKGAENMSGPWLCLRCGVGGRPISIPSYKNFRRHLINVHKEVIDSRICEHCGYRVAKISDMPDHMASMHQIRSAEKNAAAKKAAAIARKEVQHCIYCNKVFSKELLLYNHMKTAHKDKAREDGVLDFSDDEQEFVDDADKYVPNDPTSDKIKILSNITIPAKGNLPFVFDSNLTTVSQIGGAKSATSAQINLEPSSEAEALSNVATGIATSLGLIDNSVIDDSHFTGQYDDEHHHQLEGNDGMMTKLLSADGAELELTQSQKDEILSQLQGSSSSLDNVVMVLNQEGFEGTEMMGSADSQNIVVVYSQSDVNLSSTTSVTNVVSEIKAGSSISTEETTQKEANGGKLEKTERTDTGKVDASKNDDTEDIEATQPYSYETEKIKLISELQDDWSEEEEEEPIIDHAKPVKSIDDAKQNAETELTTKIEEEKSETKKTTDLKGDDDEPEIATANTDEKPSDKKEQELTSILDEWYEAGTDDSSTLPGEEKKKKEDEEEPEIKTEEDEPEAKDEKTSKENEPEKSVETMEVDDEAEDVGEPATEKKTVEDNPEIKTLINDWDDEEDGDDI